jgi:hypothetical protein
MAPKKGYKVRIFFCLALAVLLLWVTFNNSDTIPEWWSYLGIAGAVLCLGGAFRLLQLERYYEGPRTRIVVASVPSTQAAASRRSRR